MTLQDVLNPPMVSVILPAYNEADALPKVLDEFLLQIDRNYEIIVVDDGSTDETSQVVTRYPFRLIKHSSNLGKGAAVRTGIKAARGDYIVVMDADASYPASAVPQLVSLLATHDLVRCTRTDGKEHMPRINRLGNWFFDRLLGNVIGLGGEDQLSGLYGVHRDDLVRMDLSAQAFDLEAEINWKAKVYELKVAYFPINYQKRLGQKKLHPLRDGWLILNRILFMFLAYNPIAIFVIPGFLIMLLGLLGAGILSNTNLETPYFGLNIHSFILGTIGILLGFQMMIFGVTAALYATEAGYRPKPWLFILSSVKVRFAAGMVGFLLALSGFVGLAILVIEWIAAGTGPFTETRVLVLNSTILVVGVQLLSASLFLSIFAERTRKKKYEPAV